VGDSGLRSAVGIHPDLVLVTDRSANFVELRKAEVRRTSQRVEKPPRCCFRPRLGAIYADFGAFRVRIAVAASSMPTFSTRCSLLGHSVIG
jgi:hypothetical protein